MLNGINMKPSLFTKPLSDNPNYNYWIICRNLKIEESNKLLEFCQSLEIEVQSIGPVWVKPPHFIAHAIHQFLIGNPELYDIDFNISHYSIYFTRMGTLKN